MYDFWYHFRQLKYRENAKLCYMDTKSFTVYIKTDNIYVDLVKDFEKRFDTRIRIRI